MDWGFLPLPKTSLGGNFPSGAVRGREEFQDAGLEDQDASSDLCAFVQGGLASLSRLMNQAWLTESSENQAR